MNPTLHQRSILGDHGLYPGRGHRGPAPPQHRGLRAPRDRLLLRGTRPLTMGGRWEDAGVVRGFSTAAANDVLLAFVRAELARRPGLRVLDVGCGAARNAAPMAVEGATVIGTDVAWPMLEAARQRAKAAGLTRRVALVRAPMDHLPVAPTRASTSWSLTGSGTSRGPPPSSAARSPRPRGSPGRVRASSSSPSRAPRSPPATSPIPGEPFVFTQFAGEPQCFLTEASSWRSSSAPGSRRTRRGRSPSTTARCPAARSRAAAP